MNSETLILVFPFLLFLVAFLYASVGHGGASGYLALMALLGFSTTVMKSSSLILNVFVSLISFWQFYKGGYFKMKLFLPFGIIAIPFAFLGTLVPLDDNLYKQILGTLLLFPVLRLLGIFGKESDSFKNVNLSLGLVFGAAIGLLSGMIGIGGGIILSPLILLLKWGSLKESAAVSALFIFLNSLAGLAGMATKGFTLDPWISLWILIAIGGGWAGAYFGRNTLKNKFLKSSLATVLLIASVKLLVVK